MLAAAAPQYCCYGCRLAAAIAGGGPSGKATMTLTRLGAAILLTMNVMVFTTFTYGRHVYESGGVGGSALGETTATVLRFLSLLFTFGVIALLGFPIAVSACTELGSRRLNTDLLIVVGVAAAFVYSYLEVLRDGDGLYFDTACMTLVLVTIGKYLEATGKLRTSAALSDLEALLPHEVNVIIAGQQVSRPVEQVRPGDHVYVKPGGRIPIDGRILEGQAHVDQQTLTGESEPALKRLGDTVLAGTLCLDGALTLETTAIGRECVLAGVIDLLNAARLGKGRYQRLADRVTAVFVPAVIALAFAGALAALDRGTDHAILTGLAVLLISCPCALGLATPMALSVALGRAARRGALIRNVTSLETLAGVRSVCFDKTGTLTTGQPAVIEHRIRADGDRDHASMLARAGGLACAATHHLASGLSRYLAQQGIAPLPVTDVRDIAGRGVIGRLSPENRLAGLGSPALMREQGYTWDEDLAEFAKGVMERGRPLTCLGWADNVRAVFGFSEEPRPEAKAAIAALRRESLEVRVLTGDHRARAERLAEQLGVPVEPELLPAEKLERLRQLPKPVVMVGDGINDAPALAAADVGLAMGCGADISRESADVCLVTNDLTTLPWLIELSRRAVRTVRLNLFWAFAYNVFGIALAMTGKLTPVFAAIAMVLSSLLVTAHSLRLGRVEIEGAA